MSYHDVQPPDLLPILSPGKHRNPRTGACFMELVSLLAGEPWSDHPACTHPLLAAVARHVNDHTSDAGRQRLTDLIPSVIGLTGDDLHIDARIALRSATMALPVVAAERQPVMAVSVLACDRVLAELDGRVAGSLEEQSRLALAELPQPAEWAYQFTSGVRPSAKGFRRQAAPTIVQDAVESIAQACVPDPDGMLRGLLIQAIDVCAAWAAATDHGAIGRSRAASLPRGGDGPTATAGRWRRPERVYDLLAPLARLLVWLLADLRVVGAERIPAHGGVLLAANHVSFLDPLVLAVAVYDCGRRKVRFLALADPFDHPLVGWVLRGTRMIPVARGRGVARMAEDACAALEAGQAVLVYSEGTIVPPGESCPARPGAGLVALRASVPVLPIASQGVERRRCRRLPRLRRRVTVVIGPPVDLSSWQGRLDRQAQLEASTALLASVQALRHSPQGG